MDPLVVLPVIIAIVWGLFAKVRKMRRNDTPAQEYVGMAVISAIVLIFLVVAWWIAGGFDGSIQNLP